MQGPIKKDKASFIISGRRTYVDILSKPFIPKTSNFYGSGYFFYDLNAKITQNPTPNDKITLSGYLGSDHLTFAAANAANSLGLQWGNRSASGDWTHVFGSELFSKLILSGSRYASEFTVGSAAQPVVWNNGIIDYTASESFEYFPNAQQTIKFGLQATAYDASLKIQSGTNPPNAYGERKPYYGAIYLQDEWKVRRNLTVNWGLRYDYVPKIKPLNNRLSTAILISMVTLLGVR